jgi:hypothetical protein
MLKGSSARFIQENSTMVVKRYSPLVQAGFVVVKWLSLLVAGFVIAYLLSACLRATLVLTVLRSVVAAVAVPIIGIVLCLAAFIIAIESWK